MNGLRKFIEKMQRRILLTKDSVVRSEHFTRIYTTVSSETLEQSLWVQSLRQDY